MSKTSPSIRTLTAMKAFPWKATCLAKITASDIQAYMYPSELPLSTVPSKKQIALLKSQPWNSLSTCVTAMTV